MAILGIGGGAIRIGSERSNSSHGGMNGYSSYIIVVKGRWQAGYAARLVSLVGQFKRPAVGKKLSEPNFCL